MRPRTSRHRNCRGAYASVDLADTRNNLAGYVIVQAPSHEAAAKMFENHPHFMIFPGDSVEIMECLPIPGQSG